MTKYKATWSLYSSRRKITLESLIKQGKVTGYESYVKYCENLSVEPISSQDFQGQTSHLLPKMTRDLVKETPAPAAKFDSIPPPDEEQKPEQTVVEAPDLSKNKKKYNKWEKSTSQEAAVTDEIKKED